jgi:hypothetical protein
VLCLPDGADQYDLARLDKFYDAAIENAIRWYEHANGSSGFGRMASNRSLYLVTGCDKSPSWGVASFASSSQQCDVSLKFTISPITEGSAHATYSWESWGPAAVGVSPICSGLTKKYNQSPFARGFKISIRQGPMSKLRRPVKLTMINGDEPGKFVPSAQNSYNPGDRRKQSSHGHLGGIGHNQEHQAMVNEPGFDGSDSSSSSDDYEKIGGRLNVRLQLLHENVA